MRLLGFWFGGICFGLLFVLTLGIYGIYSIIWVNSRGQTWWHPFFGFQAVDYETGKPVPWIFAWLLIPGVMTVVGLLVFFTGPLAIVIAPAFNIVNVMTVSLTTQTFRLRRAQCRIPAAVPCDTPINLSHFAPKHCLTLLDSRLYT